MRKFTTKNEIEYKKEKTEKRPFSNMTLKKKKKNVNRKAEIKKCNFNTKIREKFKTKSKKTFTLKRTQFMSTHK